MWDPGFDVGNGASIAYGSVITLDLRQMNRGLEIELTSRAVLGSACKRNAAGLRGVLPGSDKGYSILAFCSTREILRPDLPRLRRSLGFTGR